MCMKEEGMHNLRQGLPSADVISICIKNIFLYKSYNPIN